MIFPNAKYEIFVCDNQGNIVAPFNKVDFNLFLDMDITRAVGEVGACYIRLSGGTNSNSILSYMARYGMMRKDSIFVIYRTVGTQRSLFLDTIWFVRSIDQYREATGSFVIKITAYDTNYLLASRLTSNQFGGKPQTAFTNVTLSTIMYELVRDNMGVKAELRRMPLFSEGQAISGWGNNIEYYSPTGQTFAYANLLSALQELQQMSLTPVEVDDTIYPLYFDVIAVDTNSFVFMQYANQRGVDRRFYAGNSKAVVLSDTMGHLRDVRFSADWLDEKTSVTAVYTNTPTGGNTTITTSIANDKTRIANSPFSLRETLLTASSANPSAEALKAVRDPMNYPQFSAYATIQDVPGFLFDVDWGYGDYLTLNVFGTQVDVRVNAIRANITDKSEQIQTKLQVSESFSF